MDPALAERKGKKRKAPAPPNPFTGEVEDGDSTNPFDEDEDKADNMTIDTEEVNDFKPMLIKESSIDFDVGVSCHFQIVHIRMIIIIWPCIIYITF